MMHHPDFKSCSCFVIRVFSDWTLYDAILRFQKVTMVKPKNLMNKNLSNMHQMAEESKSLQNEKCKKLAAAQYGLAHHCKRYIKGHSQLTFASVTN
jgi:hypothetical protein